MNTGTDVPGKNRFSSGILLLKSVNCVLETALVGRIAMVAPAVEGIAALPHGGDGFSEQLHGDGKQTLSKAG